MNLPDIIAALMFVGVIAYGIFGGADYGSGIWDLFAGNAKHGAKIRTQIDHSIGPVWEANHVWIIYVLVFLWSAFPTGFSALMTTLWIPWTVVVFGIVLRGSGFAFRKFSANLKSARFFGAIFALSSFITPFFLGMIVGAIVGEKVTLQGGDILSSWTSPTSWLGGTLAVLTCAFLAATFLTSDAARAGDTEVANYCAKRAIGTGVATGIVAILGIFILQADVPKFADRLESRGWWLILLSAIFGIGTMVLLRTKHSIMARFTSAAAVASVLIGWGVSQYPYFFFDSVTIDDVAGSDATLTGLLIVFLIAAVTAVPALIWLYYLATRKENNLQT